MKYTIWIETTNDEACQDIEYQLSLAMINSKSVLLQDIYENGMIIEADEDQ